MTSLIAKLAYGVSMASLLALACVDPPGQLKSDKQEVATEIPCRYDSATIDSVYLTRSRYSSCMVLGEAVWALSDSGVVRRCDLTHHTLDSVPAPWPRKITCLGKDGQKRLLFGTASGEIVRVLPNGRTDIVAQVGREIWGLAVNSSGRGYAVTNLGITAFDSLAFQVPETFSNREVRMNRGGLAKPKCMFMDSHDRLWLGYHFGEWGGGLILFDTRTGRFLDSLPNGKELPAYNVQSIFEDDKERIIITSGLMHFEPSGSIYRYDDTTGMRKLYDRGWNAVESEYIGPGAYNPHDGLLYYYSDKGFSRLTSDTDSLEFEPFFKPRLWWTYGQRDAVGYGMNVESFEFLDRCRIVFLSTGNGIGYFDGSTITYFR